MDYKPYIRNCYIKSREGDMHTNLDAPVIQLDGYVLMPIEEFLSSLEDAAFEGDLVQRLQELMAQREAQDI